MTPRILLGLDAAPGTVPTWMAALPHALAADGPALLPLPDGPRSLRDRLVADLRANDPKAPVDPDGAGGARVALVVPTSGSTGMAKGVQLTSAALLASAAGTQARLDGPGTWVLALPHTHIAGLMVLIRSLVAGTEPVVVRLDGGFRPQQFADATAQALGSAGGRPLYTSLVPTQLDRLLDASVDLTGYSAVLVGAAVTPSPLLDRARSAGARIVTTYGMTETCGGCVYEGAPLSGVTVAVDGSGRVVLGGLTLFSGYRMQPELTAACTGPAGELVTNDLGRLHPDGRLEILGRADDVIISGGENVVPSPVEDALRAQPGVRQCVVVGVADPEWGQRVVAVVEMDGVEPGHLADAATEDLRRALRSELPAGWLPRQVVVTARLPMLPSGKPDPAAVRDLAQTARERG